jgi:protein TonB
MVSAAHVYWPFGLAPRSAATQEEQPAPRCLAASVLWHALVIGIFFLPIWHSAEPPLPVIATLLFEESGSSGATGSGAGGGGENAAVTAPESRAAPPSETAERTPAPPAPEPSPSEAAAPQSAPIPPPPPETKLAQLPEKPRAAPAPPKPRAKPAPPRAAPPPPTPVQRAEAPARPAQATPGPARGVGMAANAPSQTGTSGNSGVGRGAEGSGQGALGEGAEGPGDEYFERLRRHLKRYQRWPEESKKEKGTAVVTFTISRDGTVRAAEIERSSGYAILDEATLDMLRRASPVPPLPTNFRGEQITISIPAEWKRGIFLKKLF